MLQGNKHLFAKILSEIKDFGKAARAGDETIAGLLNTIKKVKI